MGFGPKVLGEAAYKQVVATKKGKAGFGPRVIGAAGAAKLALVGATAAVAVSEPVKANVPAVAEGVSVEQVQTILAENPAFLEPLHVAELERTEGPRREALLALQAVAKQTGNTEIDAEITELLAEMPAVPAVPTDPAATDPAALSIDLAALAFNELKAFAKSKGVDMNKNRSRADITTALEDILTAPAAT